MKLIIAIVNKRDREKVMDSLSQTGHQFTNVATTGGFLHDGNTTLLIGCEDNVVDEIIDIIRNTCKSREQYVTQSMPDLMGGSGMTMIPLKINVGGAIIFVVDVEKFERV